MGKKGQRSERGKGEIYEESKSSPLYVLITPTAAHGIDALATLYRLSRSEFIEQIGRGTLKVFPAKHFSKAIQRVLSSSIKASSTDRPI